MKISSPFRFKITSLFLIVILTNLSLSAQNINTFVGDGTVNSSGDGGLASAATIERVMDVTADTANNIYIIDYNSSKIRKIDATTGIITTIAGTGVNGFFGDGGPATSATLHSPQGLTVDDAGNIYIADYQNNRIRKLDATNGFLTTIAGNGTGTSTGDGGPAIAATLDGPSTIDLDTAGNIYFSEFDGDRIRKINISTGIITTVAGTGVAGFSGDGGIATAAQLERPRGLGIDQQNNLYIADWTNNRVRKVDGVTGIITTVAGTGTQTSTGDGGLATSANLNRPWDVEINANGNIFISEMYGHKIRKINTNTGVISTVIGTGVAGSSGDGGAASLAQINQPLGIGFDHSNNLYISEYIGSRVRIVDPCPVVTFTALTDLCIDAGTQTALGGGLPIGGTYTGIGVTDDGNGTSFSFNPSSAGAGTHALSYSYTENGCTVTKNDSVEVFPLPVVTFTAPNDLCIDAGIQSGLATGLATGGNYSGNGVTDDGNGTSFTFNPSSAGASTHTITYTYTDQNSCTNSATDDIEVFALPIVTFTAPADLCIDVGLQNGLSSGTPTGGIYSGNGVTDSGNGTSYSFNPNNAGAAIHTISYAYTDGNSCSNIANDDIEVFSIDTSITYVSPTLTSNQIVASSYQWIDCATENSIPGETNQSFTASTGGSYAVIVEANGCIDTSACVDVTIASINRLTSTKNIVIIPNPTTGLLNIKLKGAVYNATIIIYDVLGKEIINKKLQSNRTTIDLTENNKGLYFVKIQTENDTEFKRVILQ